MTVDHDTNYAFVGAPCKILTFKFDRGRKEDE